MAESTSLRLKAKFGDSAEVRAGLEGSVMKKSWLALALLSSGCGRVLYGGDPQDVGVDAVGADVGGDVGADALVDAFADDTGPDAGVDASFDASLDDAGVDASVLDVGVDASFDAGMDASFDAGRDVGVDASFDAGRDGGSDAGSDAGPIRTPIDIAPRALLASDWTHRSFIRTMSDPCSIAVTYEPIGGAPDDRMQMALTGCPMNGAGRDFADIFEWDSQDVLDGRDGRICRIDLNLDTSRQSSLSPNTCFTSAIGVLGTQVGTGSALIHYSNIHVHCPSSTTTFPWVGGIGLIARDGLIAAGMDLTQPLRFVLMFRVLDWGVDPADQVVSYDNPHFRVTFDRDADGVCDDVDPTP